MRAANGWEDYTLIDASSGNRLEQWADVLLIRPDPQVVWNTEKKAKEWYKADAIYHRSSKGGGEWEYKHKLPQKWEVHYKDLTFIVSPTGFKHTGLFPEQAVNWDLYREKIEQANRPIKVLNLFAYTGGATLACAASGASVTHVDSSKGMIAWGKENAKVSGLEEKPIRWIIDDCTKFVMREIRRGSLYDAVIMDPPSYGRGPDGEMWKLEDQIFDLISLCANVLTDNPLFFSVNSYTTGLSPAVMEYILNSTVKAKYGGKTSCGEIGLPVKETGGILPCGATALWESK